MSGLHRLQEHRRRLLRRILAGWSGSRCFSGPIPGRGIHCILLVRPNHRLGNALLLTPLLAEIERAYPGAEVDILSAGTAVPEVFAMYPMVRNLWLLPRGIVRHPLAAWGMVRRMRSRHYDLAIDPCIGSQSGRLLVMRSRAKYKLGFVGPGLAGGVNCGIPVPYDLEHMAQLPVYLLRTAREEAFASQPCPPLDIRLSEAELAEGRARVRLLAASCASGSKPVIALFGDATGAKALEGPWWESVIAQLRERYADATFIEIVPVSANSKFEDRFPTYYSTSIRKMAAVMAGCDLILSADCGVMHLAAASGAPTVGIFNVTRKTQYGPYGPRNAAICVTERTPTDIAREIALGHTSSSMDARHKGRRGKAPRAPGLRQAVARMDVVSLQLP